MAKSLFVTSAQQLSAQREKNISYKVLHDGINVLKCYMDQGLTCMKPIFGALAVF